MSNKIVIERVYNVPLRLGYFNTPRYKRTKKAVKVLREFLQKHMKSDNLRLGRKVNEFLWKNGIKNPPHHVKVTAIKYEDGSVTAELFGYKFVDEKKQNEEKKLSKLDELKAKAGLNKSTKSSDKKDGSKLDNVVDEKSSKTVETKAKEVKEETPKSDAKVESDKE